MRLVEKVTPTIIIDTREQRPFAFPRVATIRKKLDVGDYAILGAERELCIERKELADFINWSVIERHERCAREIERARASQTRLVVLIEAARRDVILGRYRAAIQAECILGAERALAMDGIPVIWAGDGVSAAKEWAPFENARRCARDIAEKMLLRVFEKIQETNKKETNVI